MEQQELLGKSKVYLPSLEYGEQFHPKPLSTNRRIDFDLLAVSPTDGKKAFTKYSVLPPIGHSFCEQVTGKIRDKGNLEVTNSDHTTEQRHSKKSSRSKRQRDWKKTHSTSTSTSHLGLRKDLFQNERRESGSEALINSDASSNNGDYNGGLQLCEEISQDVSVPTSTHFGEAKGNQINSESDEERENNINVDDEMDESEKEKPKFSLWKTKMLRIMNRYKDKFQNVDGDWKEQAEQSVANGASQLSNNLPENNNNDKAAGVMAESKTENDEDLEGDDVQAPSVSRRDAVCRTNDEQLHYFLLLRNLRDFGLI